MSEQNAYSILSVQKGASEKEIKDAYYSMVKKYDNEKHPERYMVIQNAYDRLRDPQKRAREDVLTYDYIKGEFHWTDEEKVDADVAELEERIRKTRESIEQGSEDPGLKTALVGEYQRLSYQHVQKKQWQDAINDWVEILKLDPTHQRAKNNLTFAYVHLGYYYALHDLNEEAIRLWEQALKMDPGRTELVHNLALASEKAGDDQRAQRYWTENVKRWKSQLEKNPDDDYLRHCLMEVHRHHGGKALESVQTPETQAMAIESYREVLRINPDDFDAQFSLAGALMQERKFDEAITALKKLNSENPDNLDVINQLGWAYLNGGKFETAFSTWRRALHANPKAYGIRDSMLRAHMAVGKKLKEGGHYTQALVHFKEYQKMMPNQWEVHLEIGETVLKRGDKRTALVEFQKVLEMDPKNKAAKKGISEIRMRS